MTRPARFLAPALIAIAGVTLLVGLGDRPLWEDEAETALLARNVLEQGLPYAVSPGRPVISQAVGQDIGFDGLWTWTPWVQIYWAALSMRVFGATAAGSRAGFALLGILGLWAFWRLARRCFDGDERASLLALLFTAGSVPLLLHFRQCRWYAAGFFFATLWLWGYWKIIARERRGALLLVAGLAGLFHTQQLSFAALAASFAACHLAFFRSRTREFVRPTLCAAALCLPWLALQSHFKLFYRVPFGWEHKMLYYLSELNAHHWPLALGLPWLVWLGLRRRKDPVDKRLAFTLGLLACYLAVISSGSYTFFHRYLIPILPAVGLVQGFMWRDILAKLPMRWAAVALLALGAQTNLLNMALAVDSTRVDHRNHFRPRWVWSDYAAELSSPPSGPISALLGYLERNAKPGEVVWISYGDLPLRFHDRVGLKVFGGLSGQRFSGLPRPDWIVLRSWKIWEDWMWDRLMIRYVKAHFDHRQFRRTTLAAKDIPWESNPDPDQHYFREFDEEAPPIMVFRRK